RTTYREKWLDSSVRIISIILREFVTLRPKQHSPVRLGSVHLAVIIKTGSVQMFSSSGDPLQRIINLSPRNICMQQNEKEQKLSSSIPITNLQWIITGSLRFPNPHSLQQKYPMLSIK